MKANESTRWFAAAWVLGLASAALAAGALVESYGPATVLFGIHPTTGVHDLSDEYQVKNLECVAEIDPPTALEIPGTAGNFFNVLSAAYPQPPWTYTSAVAELTAGSLAVETYDAVGDPAEVGADFHLKYTPGAGDPAGIHWVQVVTNNHALAGGHGVGDNKVDVPAGQADPYYDTIGAADATDFLDKPRRVDTDLAHTWTADLYVVTGPASGAGPGAINLHHPGVRWGWKNSCVAKPEPGGYFCVPDPNQPAVTLQASGPVEPGAMLTASAVLPAAIRLTKGPISTTVELLSGSLSVAVDETIRPGGSTRYTLTGGGGQFAPYEFGPDFVGPSTFHVLSGHGVILWESNEVSLHARVRVSAAGYPDIVAVADGTGVLDPLTNTVVIDSDAIAIERVGVVPILSTLQLSLLAGLLLLGAVATSAKGNALRRAG
jgi:hypothetical protein